MTNVTFTGSEPPLTETDLDFVESGLGISLPTQVRQHYLRHNGGAPTPNCFEKDGEFWVVNEFYPIRYGKEGNRLEDAYRRLVVSGETFFPRGLIPIALDPGGDVYCFRTASDKQGAICCWVSEYYDDPALAVVDLADSLDEFLNALIPCPD